MFRNYLASALRNLARNRLYAAINIVGLAVGFAAAILIALFVRDEFSYDKWLPGYERTYLLTETLRYPDRTPLESHTTPVELAEPLKLDFSSIQAVTRLVRISISLRHGDIEGNETIFWADPNLFEVLPLPAIAGDLKTALGQPDGIVLTRRMARKYFGRDDPIGETLEIDRQHPMRVAAIIEDLPSNTHLTTEIIGSGLATFSFLAQRKAHPLPPGAWNSAGWTYLRLAPGASAEKLQPEMPSFLDRHMKEATSYFSGVSFWVVPISSVHLQPENNSTAMKPTDDPATAYALSAIGMLILAIAGINFVNLMTARATRRAVEVGVRKVTGAGRRHLIIQFLGESLLYAGLGGMLAVAIVELLLPRFNAFLDRTIVLDYWGDSSMIGGVVAAVLLVGTLAGSYPAFVLSAFMPAAVLKGGIIQASGSGAVRQGLVVAQFAILIGLIVGTAVIYRQTSFALNEGLRLDKDQVLLIATECRSAFPDRVRALPGVRAAACSNASGLQFGTSNGPLFRKDGTHVLLAIFPIDFGFFELYGLKPLAGRFFDRDHGSDAVPLDAKGQVFPPLVINEAASRMLGFATPQAAVNQTVAWMDADFKPAATKSEIIGVVPDFSLDSIHKLVSPGVYFVDPRNFYWLNVKLSGRNLPETLKAIDQLWKETGEPRPITRLFLDQEVQKLYLDITRQSQLFAGFAGIALFIACLGLFGLSAFTAERRTKEIGIRKAMGAGSLDIVRLLVWQFAKPVLLANLIAWPVGWFFMNRWLHGFAYHVDLSPWLFLASGAAALAIALLTVSAHAILVARAKPVAALRYE